MFFRGLYYYMYWLILIFYLIWRRLVLSTHWRMTQYMSLVNKPYIYWYWYLFILIIGSPTALHIRTYNNKNPTQILLVKETHHRQNMNDNIMFSCCFDQFVSRLSSNLSVYIIAIWVTIENITNTVICHKKVVIRYIIHHYNMIRVS